MQSVEDYVKINQCLHGYVDGHQLMQTSAKLPPKADQLLLTLSDMSGPNMVPGFQSYLTGYPVSGTSWYAFAKTWYASEMRRPGCVWTHTLLIDSADLARMQDLRVLLALFIRPTKEQSQSNYARQLRLVFNSVSRDHRELPPREVVLQVLAGLYEKPDRPVYLIAHNADEYTDLAVEIWNQQYSKLRRSFLFCTGSLANRKVPGRTFDFQVIPLPASKHIQREISDGVFIEAGNNKVSVDAPRWLNIASDDLLFSTEDNLHPFLMLFGADAPEGRGALPQLLDIYTQISGAKSRGVPLSKIISVVAEYYPDAQEGMLLKQTLLGNAKVAHRFLPSFSEMDVLSELAVTEHHAAFNAEALKLRERARQLVKNEPRRFKELIPELLKYEVNSLGENIIAGICEAVTPEDALDLAAQRYNLLFAFIKYNPSLLTLPKFWQQSSDRQRELYDLVTPLLQSGDVALTDLVRSMLEARSDVLALELVRQYPVQVIIAVLDWLDSSKDSTLAEGWALALTDTPEGLLQWLDNALDPRVQTMAFLACLLDPHSQMVRRFGTERWFRLARVKADELDEQSRIRAMTFLLALSFNNPDAQSPELVAEAFQVVYDAAAQEKLSYGSWRQLMYQAPSLSWWGEWDKCERLRHALVDKFIRYKWAPEFFIKAVRREDTFKEILSSFGRKGSERKFLRRVAREVDDGHIPANEERRRALVLFL